MRPSKSRQALLRTRTDQGETAVSEGSSVGIGGSVAVGAGGSVGVSEGWMNTGVSVGMGVGNTTKGEVGEGAIGAQGGT